MSEKNTSYHVALSVPFDLEEFSRAAAADLGPRHAMAVLSDDVGATVHLPRKDEVRLIDKLKEQFPGCGTSDQWALARRLAQELGQDDVIFTIGEDVGFPLASCLKNNERKPRLVVFVHHPERPRVRYMFWRYGLAERVDFFITNTEYKAAALRDLFGISENRVFCIDEQADTMFFRPLPHGSEKKRPLIGSGGLEQRDYITLAEATQHLNVDVRICAMSPNATAKGDTFPRVLPRNMTVNQYGWQELRQLYNESDLVAICLKEHSYQAGLTTLFEALACRRPVIMTKTPGLASKFAEEGLITAVPSHDPTAMREVIEDLLEDSQRREKQAELGFQAVTKHYNCDRYVSDIKREMLSVQARPAWAAQ